MPSCPIQCPCPDAKPVLRHASAVLPRRLHPDRAQSRFAVLRYAAGSSGGHGPLHPGPDGSVAETEAGLMSEHTKAALKPAKALGVELGG